MNRIPSLLGIFLAALLAGASARAQAPAPAATNSSYPFKVTLADGRTLSAAAMRRSGATLLVTVPVANGVRGEIGYPLATVRKIEIPEPPQLKSARQLVTDGKAAQALSEIGGVVAAQSGLREIPGNYWAPAALIEVDALIALKRDREAQNLIGQLSKDTKDAELLQSARLALATLWARSGQVDKAVPVFNETIASSKDGATLARAWTSKGDAFLAAEDYDSALLAYLRVPIFYSNEDAFVPAALLGSARAYEGLGNFDLAREALTQLNKDYADSPEAIQSKADLARIDRKNRIPTN
jgi:tetratricopeptide (TPR) repeat protein